MSWFQWLWHQVFPPVPVPGQTWRLNGGSEVTVTHVQARDRIKEQLIEQEKNKYNKSAEVERLIREMEYKQDIWKKVKINDYWTDYKYVENSDFKVNKWITTSTNTIVKPTSVVTIKPIDSVNKWFTKLDQN